MCSVMMPRCGAQPDLRRKGKRPAAKRGTIPIRLADSLGQAAVAGFPSPGHLAGAIKRHYLPPGRRWEILSMTGWRTALPLGAAFFCALSAFFVVPRGFEAQSLLLAQDDPTLLANYALDRSFDAAVADREIRSALA